MMKLGGYWERFKDWVYAQGAKKMIVYAFITLAAGVCIMISFRPSSKSVKTEEQPAVEPPVSAAAAQDAPYKADRERDIEARLEAVLSLISGAGRVKVMVTLSGAPEGDTLAVNTETRRSDTAESDSEGGAREVMTGESKQSYVIIRGSNGDETPLIIKPQGYIIEGVAIVAEGGDNIAVKDALTRAAYTVLGIPAHKVQVVKMKK